MSGKEREVEELLWSFCSKSFPFPFSTTLRNFFSPRGMTGQAHQELLDRWDAAIDIKDKMREMARGGARWDESD